MSPSPGSDLRQRDAAEQMRAGWRGGPEELGTDGVMTSCLAVLEFFQLSFHRYTGWRGDGGSFDITFPFLQCQLTLHLCVD